jgi:GNAT superfamily N-acetyltransferase
LTGPDDPAVVALAELHMACVDEGAFMSFKKPLARDNAIRYWTKIANLCPTGQSAVLVAEDERGLIGTVTLVLSMPDNQQHRAELVKLMVAVRARGTGLGLQLLQAAEALAIELGRTLLVLDTVTGSTAEGMYERHGWTRVGEIPNYAMGPDGVLEPTTIFYRLL